MDRTNVAERKGVVAVSKILPTRIVKLERDWSTRTLKNAFFLSRGMSVLPTLAVQRPDVPALMVVELFSLCFRLLHI